MHEFMMLRSLLIAGRQSYTCSCIVKNCLSSKNVTPITVIASNLFHTSHVDEILSKRVREKKAILLSAKRSQQEIMQETEDEDLMLEGLTEAGVMTPTLETHSMMIGGVRYDQLPIVYIKSTKNNTIITVNDVKGNKVCRSSCGAEGFKNNRKGTNIAAQATGLSVAAKALDEGLRHVRVAVRGLGIGRLPSIKGLQMGGLQIISITDETSYAFSGKKPRKVRRT